MIGNTPVRRRDALAGAAIAAVGLALPARVESASASVPFRLPSQAATARRYSGQRPTYWGLTAPGVIRRFSTATANGKNAVCLTFDACGGSVTRYDAALIATLRQYKVPATLFVNRTWATNNPSILRSLLADPLFQIENHGHRHIPLSVTGRSAYGIKGTTSVGDVWREIAECNWYLGYYFNHQTRFMRPGTAYSDDVAARAAAWMGQPLVGFAINGDAGASYPAGTVYTEVLKARPGDIVISHFNHPGGGTAPGYARAIPAMLARGVKFRRLNDVL